MDSADDGLRLLEARLHVGALPGGFRQLVKLLDYFKAFGLGQGSEIIRPAGIIAAWNCFYLRSVHLAMYRLSMQKLCD